METKLNKARNSFAFKVQESDLFCPKCGGRLFEIDTKFLFILDGNSIFQCEIDDHRFWHHPRSQKMDIHLNPNATETNYDSDESFEFFNGNWISIKK